VNTGKQRAQPATLDDIAKKLDYILGYLAIRGIETDLNAVCERLRGFGMTHKEIAQLTGATEKAVEHRLSKLKKAVAKKSPGKAKKKPVSTASNADGAAPAHGVSDLAE
jgi:DNA-directed RNA polymerase specialized sigma24 family protein